MRTLDRLSGTVLLCDAAHGDRGKLHVLGAGWTQIGPDADRISAIVNVQVPPETDTEVKVQLLIWRRDPFNNDGRPDAEAEIVALMEHEPTEEAPPSWQLLAPISVPVRLRPATAYVVELRANETSLAFVTFATRDYEPDVPGEEDG
jgi:hypothetical protein